MNSEGKIVPVVTFSEVDLVVLTRRGAKLLLVPQGGYDLIKGVRDQAARGNPSIVFPEIKGVSSMAEVLPLAFPAHYEAWKSKLITVETVLKQPRRQRRKRGSGHPLKKNENIMGSHA